MCCKDKITSNGKTVGYCVKQAEIISNDEPVSTTAGELLEAAMEATSNCSTCSTWTKGEWDKLIKKGAQAMKAFLS
jgi:hypothetical protein